MKVLTLWLWEFGFAINKVLWENNPDKTFYAYELNKEIFKKVTKSREPPFFFKWHRLTRNIEVLENYDDIISEMDLLIIAIPAQFIATSTPWFMDKLKPWVTILNLAKWIDIQTNKPISAVLKERMPDVDYNYAILSWWMIASELVEWKKIWADLWIDDKKVWNEIKWLLENFHLKIKLQDNILNMELYGSLKNIMAIMVWYFEWKWYEKSTIWYHLVNFYEEMKDVILEYWWSSDLEFSYYSLWWDIIATCFGNSRNRYFGKLLWEGKKIDDVLNILKKENKHAEWYETLKAVYSKVWQKDWFETIKFLYRLIK